MRCLACNHDTEYIYEGMSMCIECVADYVEDKDQFKQKVVRNAREFKKYGY
jgi:hypothetical protein